MTYDEARDQEYLRMLEPAVRRFVSRFNPSAPTILFFPGGMASALAQATTPFTAGPPPYSYQTEWLSLHTFCGGDADQLDMAGTQDTDGRVTIPLDVIGFMGVAPYLSFEAWCKVRTQPFNLLVLPWDWRRPVEAYVALLTNTLLPDLRARILKACQADMWDTEYHWIGHSFGGIVVKLLLNGGGPFVDHLRRAITVATPFYGYGGSQHFYFAGFSVLDYFYSRRDIAQVIASFAGVYAVMFLSPSSYAEVGEELGKDPDFPLESYPSVDASVATESVDPFSFASDRYPPWVSQPVLQQAAQTCASIQAPLPAPVMAKLFHIRGVQTDNGLASGTPADATIVSQTWERITPAFDPNTDADPIQNPALGPGDGTIPAWSARLIGVDPTHVIPVAGDIEHMLMMDNSAVQDALAPLIDGAATATALFDVAVHHATIWQPIADPEEVDATLRRFANLSPVQRLVAFRTFGALPTQRVARRVLADLLKPPLSVRLRTPPPKR